MKQNINELKLFNQDIDVAKTVFGIEIEGIRALSDWIGKDFVDLLNLIESNTGKVIVSGMGKSGHIARKIASTLSSTGTPAFFVHPGEASHGDLGMITKDDIVILLSNSGETNELRDIINYCKRFNIKLVAMVRKATSVLVSTADIALVLPPIPEATIVNAPTTSTTMMLALGDAIAISLLERKSFSKEEFSIYHPGGNLGNSFIKVKNLMHSGDKVPCVGENILMSDVLLEMTSKGFGCAAVVDSNNELIGIITDGDLRRHMSNNIISLKAKDIMTKNPKIINDNSLATSALALMQEKSITSLFITNENKLVGIIHIHDLLRAGVV